MAPSPQSPDLPNIQPFSLADLEREQRWWAQHKILTYFPDTGPLRRELYPKHLEFMRAGRDHRERLFMGGNRTGKTELGAYETALHLTGDYPPWWEGRRFDGPIKAWACGTTNAKTAEIVQAKLLGDLEPDPLTPRKAVGLGTGMIPAERIVHHQAREGLKNVIRIVWVRHQTGRNSVLEFKSYEMGRRAFEGTAQHLVWADEEPDEHIYTECLTRTLTTEGLVMVTFTPLSGLSSVVLSFMPDGQIPH